MSMTFTKLASTLPGSSVWCAPYPTRIVWVTMLALCDQNGVVEASVPGLARIAGVTLEECKMALDTFLAPDEYSSSPEYDGRRIERIDRGWKLLNYHKYRDTRDIEAKREADRERQRKHRDMSRSVTRCHAQSQEVAQAEAEAEAEEDKTSTEVLHETTLSSPSPSDFNSTVMARMVCDSLGYFGLDAMRTAEQVVTAAMKQNNQNAEAAGHWIVARWNAFKRSPAGQDKWSTPKHFLTQRVFEPEVRWMGDTRLQAEAALGSRRDDGDDEAKCAADCGMTVEAFREWKENQRRKA